MSASTFRKGRIEIMQGDITTVSADAIVNAANSTLLGGGGVDGAVHRAGGPSILEECRALDGCDSGDAKLTGAGRLPSRFVIHTVGPVYVDGKHDEPELLASCYLRSLEVAAEAGARTVAFPAISCGVYGYPIGEAADIAIHPVRTVLSENNSFERIIFVFFSENDRACFEEALKESD